MFFGIISVFVNSNAGYITKNRVVTSAPAHMCFDAACVIGGICCRRWAQKIAFY